MTDRKIIKFRNFVIRTIQCSGVDKEIPLSSFINEFKNEINSIIGAHRVFDYDSGIALDIVFIYLTDAREWNQLLSKSKFMINGKIIWLQCSNMIYGKADFNKPYETATTEELKSVPHPVALFGFRKLPTMSTFYVIAVLRQFEQLSKVTGFRLAHSEKCKVTRNFGFLTVASKIEVLDLIQLKNFNVIGDAIIAKLPFACPVLIHELHADLVTKNRCKLTPEIRRLNWLHANVSNSNEPVHPVPHGREFIEQTDIRPPSPGLQPRVFQPLAQDIDVARLAEEKGLNRPPTPPAGFDIESLASSADDQGNTPPMSPNSWLSLECEDRFEDFEEAEPSVAKKSRK
ncbi:hypothetical protein PVAND_003332 [Polypedilum vanderplanki]|uniref:Uncharacterized protein n=1 Tax=Polypedilum vanderplanki TaxID=319348 RepID=A0A9J6BTQ5_POLVA|nr:hypothetical protein PVAND_003332 [Polypedilum vanderplanki]